MADYNIDSLTYGSDTYTFTIPYGTCTLGASVQEKKVTCANFKKLEAGARVAVKFTYANGHSTPKLNVNETGAKTIKFGGFSATHAWTSGSIIDFVYDGTYWWVVGYNTDSFSGLDPLYDETEGIIIEDSETLVVPYATSGVWGVVKPAAVRSSAISTTTGGTTANRYYGVEMDNTGKMFVNVPTGNPTYSYNSNTGILTITY